MSMTLEELKQKIYNLQMAHISSMSDMIINLSSERLKMCGCKSLEQFLIGEVKYVMKETEKLNRQYEKENPDE